MLKSPFAEVLIIEKMSIEAILKSHVPISDSYTFHFKPCSFLVKASSVPNPLEDFVQ